MKRLLKLVSSSAVIVGSLMSSSLLFAGETYVYQGYLTSFSSTTDSNIDLNPATKVYAIDIGASSDTTVDNGVYSLTFNGEWPIGASLGYAGNTFVDVGGPANVAGLGSDSLKGVLGTSRITWSGEEGSYYYSVNLDVVQGVTYDLQLFLAEQYHASDGQRGGNILLDGVTLVEGYSLNSKTGNPLVYHYTFTAQSDTIELQMQRGTGFNDDAGELSALTLSTVAVSEPASLTVLAGLLGVGALRELWRRRT